MLFKLGGLEYSRFCKWLKLESLNCLKKKVLIYSWACYSSSAIPPWTTSPEVSLWIACLFILKHNFILLCGLLGIWWNKFSLCLLRFAYPIREHYWKWSTAIPLWAKKPLETFNRNIQKSNKLRVIWFLLLKQWAL